MSRGVRSVAGTASVGGLVPFLVMAGLLASGCAPATERPSARSSGQEDTPSASTQASTQASPSATSTGSPVLEDSPCRVKGFVPGHRVVLRSQRRTLLYVAGLSLAPGAGVRGADRLQLVADLHPGVRAVSPSGVSVDPSVLRAVGSSVESSSPSPLPGEFFVRRNVVNRSGESRAYAQYVAARVYRGTWSARVCGSLTNDGTSITVVGGSFTTIGLTDSGVMPCDRVTGERPQWVRRLSVACD